ncbi:hypothetical protein IWX80_003017 [Flavobacterium sp. CAN_S2]
MPFICFDWLCRGMEGGQMEKNLLKQSNAKDNRSVFSKCL